MSKERARRRAVRLAEQERTRAARAAVLARRQRRRELARRLIPRQRRTGRLYARRTRVERAGIVLTMLMALVLIWGLVDSLALRVVLTTLVLLAAPALIVLTLDRRM